MSEGAIEIRKNISLHGVDLLNLFGTNDVHLRLLEGYFKLNIIARGNALTLIGSEEEISLFEKVLQELTSLIERNQQLNKNDIMTVAEMVKSGAPVNRENNTGLNSVILYTKDGAISPKSDGQKALFKSSKNNDIVFVIGPAGTGKTYIAVAIALAHLRDKTISKIVLARPAVEAGESLGFLPGDMLEKVDPYLRPLYDALFDMVLPSKLKKYMETEVIEVVPLAFMRGRTLNNAFVILDEAQNTNPNQMKMFLTRLGINSKAIITGDVTQIDLPDKRSSGLVQIQGILHDIEGIDFVRLTDSDVLRHRLVREIIKAYDLYDNNSAGSR
ncbi:MAG: PhoH family protein [candidate division KSB1 bacterium]|jgi:phosphate starvation-inducible PhoH-like protein|nr:PhoH family protein [candidate division KSB1 bacterium]